MKNLLLTVMIVLICSGCATKNVALKSDIGNAYQGKSITYTHHEVPDFSAMTADKAMFGGLGGPSMVSKGNKIVQENGVPDPAISIASSLANDLAAKYALTVKPPKQKTDFKKPAELAKQYNYADLVLDVQTFNWGFSYLPMNWSSYRILYFSRLKLIDTKTAEVIASGAFNYDSKDSGFYPSYGQLTNNKADGLKNELKKAEKACIENYKDRIFKLSEVLW
ncbi:MAG: hypothetical protein JXR25_13805 [Pontiellaceae bacterium]|nr:hypothetical protein [Pontiellaceae bacterium]